MRLLLLLKDVGPYILTEGDLPHTPIAGLVHTAARRAAVCVIKIYLLVSSLIFSLYGLLLFIQ